MDVKDFLQAYKNIAKSIATQDEIDTLYDSLFYITRGTHLEKNFVDDEANRLDKIIAIDDVAHRLHSKEPEILEKLFPDSDRNFVKNKLDNLAGLEVESDVRKYNRDYFTTLTSDSGLFFISKQVGRTSVDDIGNELEHYKNLYEAQIRDKDDTDILSNGELVTLWRVYKDKKYKSLMGKRGIVDPLVVGGYASVEVIDREGHLITIDALKKAFKEFMKSFRTRNVMLAHSDVQIAFPLPVYVNDKGEVFKSGVDNKGLYLISEVRLDTQIAQKVRDAIESGELKSYSIAGTATDKEVVTKNGRTYMQVNALDLAEVTLCLLGEEKIWTINGLVKIKDIIEGDKVLTHKLNWKNVVKTMNRKVDENLIKITTENGNITCTKEHPIRALVYGGRHNGTRYEWIEAGNLKEGNLLSFKYPISYCEYCNNPVFVKKEGIRIWTKKYCSKKCRYSAPGNRKGKTLASGDPGAIKHSLKVRGVTKKENPNLSGGIKTIEGKEKHRRSVTSLAFCKMRSRIQKIVSQRPEIKEKLRNNGLKTWEERKNNPKKLEKWFKSMRKGNRFVRGKQHKMTKPEVLLNSILDNKWEFIGDGTFFIAGKCPDFWDKNSKIIELYGEYWHRGENPQDRIDLFKSQGYDTLIIWEHELKDVDKVKEKINEFSSNKLSKITKIEKIPYKGMVYNIEVEDDNSYVTEFATVHNCSKPVNQESNFKMIKSEDKMSNENKLEKMVSENPLSLDDIDDDNFDKEALRLSIVAEHDAINLYEQISNRTKNDNLKKLMLDINREEKIHIGELELLLEQLDKEHSESVEDGKTEAEEVIKSKSEKDKIEDSQDEMDTEDLNLPGVSDDNTPDISIGRKINVDELPEDRQRFVTAGGRKIVKDESKLEIFERFLSKEQMTPPHPGLVFDRQRHRWVKPYEIAGSPVAHNKEFLDYKISDRFSKYLRGVRVFHPRWGKGTIMGFSESPYRPIVNFDNKEANKYYKKFNNQPEVKELKIIETKNKTMEDK